MGILDTTKWVKPFELEIPKSMDWEAVRTLESKFGFDFKTTWDWALSWRKILWYSQISAIGFLVLLSAPWITIYLIATSPISETDAAIMFGIWLLLGFLCFLMMTKWYEIESAISRSSRGIFAKCSNRYRFWIEIRLLVFSAYWKDAEKNAEDIVAATDKLTELMSKSPQDSKPT